MSRSSRFHHKDPTSVVYSCSSTSTYLFCLFLGLAVRTPIARFTPSLKQISTVALSLVSLIAFFELEIPAATRMMRRARRAPSVPFFGTTTRLLLGGLGTKAIARVIVGSSTLKRGSLIAVEVLGWLLSRLERAVLRHVLLHILYLVWAWFCQWKSAGYLVHLYLKVSFFFSFSQLELSCLSFFLVSHLTSFPSDDDNPLWSRTPPTRRPSLNDYPHFPNAAL